MSNLHESVTAFARVPGMRALAWSGDWLYASRGYEVLRARMQSATEKLSWQTMGSFRTKWYRQVSVRSRLSARLFRDGFHALAILPTGGLVGAVPGAMVTMAANASEFFPTHVITRGTRPLHIAATPEGILYWGEYFDNASREEVHIYASRDQGMSWQVAYTFPKGAIRHVHNIIYDRWQACLWILTGDYGDECRVLRASCDLRQVDVVLQGNQQARAVAAVPTEQGVFFSSDTPLEANFIYHLDRQGALHKLAPISGSSIYGCRVGRRVCFSTMVEPSEVNRERFVQVYSGNIAGEPQWQPVLRWEKDIWPMGFFQYGNACLPDGENATEYLALTTIAVKGEDFSMTLYKWV